MTYRLFIMDRAYSSWSLRGFLMFDAFGIPFQTTKSNWPSVEFDAMMASLEPARTVPALRIGDGGDGYFLWDSLAIAETVAEQNPDAGHWPKDPAARAAARAVVSEMHSGFSALRQHCPMNLKAMYQGYVPPSDVLNDVDRVRQLWSWARENFGGDGPYLFGSEFTVADAFYLPVASRLASFDLPRGTDDDAYIEAVHSLPAFRRWRAMAHADEHVVKEDVADLPISGAFGPGIAPLSARAVSDVTPVNDHCPYSGTPVAMDSLAEIDGVVIGYCNQFCRDKSVADAAAWPATMKLLEAIKTASAGR